MTTMMSVEGSQSRKRPYETFDGDTQLEEPCSVPPEYHIYDEEEQRAQEREHESTQSLPTPVSIGNTRAASPARSSTGELTDAGEVTPPRDLSPPAPTSSNMPTAFAAMNGNGPPPAKKAKLSFAEKELKRINKEIRDREKAEERVRKEAEKKAQADEKTRKDGEKEAERKALAAEKARKEEERKKKDAEREEKRAVQEAEKAAKEEKKRKKEEEKQKKEDEKRKKEKSQLRLGNFFAIPANSNRSRTNSVESHSRRSMSPAPPANLAATVASPAALTPSKPQRSAYEELFPSFFQREDVTVAPISRFQRDEEAIESLQNIIDGYLLGNSIPDTQRAFNALTLFHIDSSNEFTLRGRQYIPVREIMSEYSPGSSTKVAIDLTSTDSQNSQIRRRSELLRKIPVKILHFNEDVRPPYKGTYTKRPITSAVKLARNPLRRDLPNTDYDYDSEAEWVEDDGEDLKSDGEDEEDDGDGEDMDGFLDDENDETAHSRRMVIQGDLEPISTGLCWEDRTKRSTNVKMLKYRMEVILDPKIKTIDPFTTSYWQPALAPMDPPRLPLNIMKTTSASQNALPNPSKPVKPFFSTASEVQNSSPLASTAAPAPQAKTDKDGKPKKMLSTADLPAFKTALLGDDLNTLSKVGLIEVLKKRFPGRSGAAIKNTLEVVAERVGQKEKDKRWVLTEP